MSKCPECSHLMNKEIIEGIEVENCSYCNGIFLEFGEMKEFVDNIVKNKYFQIIKKGDFKKDNEGKNIICAKCNSIMEEREYIYGSGNHINFCINCGAIYLDAGEISHIRDYEISRTESEEGRKLIAQMEKESFLISKNQEQILGNIDNHSTGNGFVKKVIYKIFR